MDLKEKLRQLNTGTASPPVQPKRKSPIGSDIGSHVNGEEVSGEFGRFFRTRLVYPPEKIHGQIPLTQFLDISRDIFPLLTGQGTSEKVNFKNALFVDTETTGLAGGTGTVPFLIGLGYFRDGGFIVEQFFMRDFHEERAVLQRLSEIMKRAEGLVSYNGKAYDLNLLSTRFTLARMDNPVKSLPHLDLLHVVRRLWRRRLGDCSLTHVERQIVGFFREGDIPGFMIPGLYFEFLRTGNGEPIRKVFDHNRWDIVTLVALAAELGRIYRNPTGALDDPLDLISMGRAMEKRRSFHEAAGCYRASLACLLPADEKNEVLRMLGFVLKRMGMWEKATAVWEEMIQTGNGFVMPYEELAKYYEHRARDYPRALDIVSQALERIRLREDLTSRCHYTSNREDLEYRLNRLKRKLSGEKKPSPVRN